MEILIAVAFLAICSYAIMETVLTANNQGGYAFRRATVISALQDQIESARGSAASGSLTATTNTSTLAVPGTTSVVSISTTIAQHTNSRVLWDITTSATWGEQSGLGQWTDAASLASVIKQ